MSIFVYTENISGAYKKAALEAEAKVNQARIDAAAKAEADAKAAEEAANAPAEEVATEEPAAEAEGTEEAQA